jgi:Transglutaminase-like superfamily
MKPLDVIKLRALHFAARIAVRMRSPIAAKRTVDSIARWLGPPHTVDEVREASDLLQGRGKCLTRALAIAARAPDAEVVIGVDPRHSTRIVAHAWVELAGTKIGDLRVPAAGSITELARLRHGSILACR